MSKRSYPGVLQTSPSFKRLLPEVNSPIKNGSPTGGMLSRASSNRSLLQDDDLSIGSSSSQKSMVTPRLSRAAVVVKEARNELAHLRADLRQNSCRVLTRLDTIGAPNIIEGAKIGSLEQVRDDLRQDDMESWCKRRGKSNSKKMTMEDKRVLRKWFLKMDADGSGEVSIEELQDPLLSAGVLKSTAEIKNMLNHVEHTEDGEVSFENFLKAVNSSKNCKKDKMKNLQKMSADSMFSMDTLLSQERRRALLKGIIDDATTRQKEVEIALQGIADLDGSPVEKKSKGSRKIKGPRDLDSMYREHEDQVNTHNDFVSALESVMSDKFRMLKHRNDQLQGHKRRNRVVAGFNFSNNGRGGTPESLPSSEQLDIRNITTDKMRDVSEMQQKFSISNFESSA